MQTVGRDSGSLQTARQLIGEEDIRQFRLTVSAKAERSVALLTLQVGKVDLGILVCCRADGDDARRGARLQPIQQEVGEQERRQVVHRQRQFYAVLGHRAMAPR